MLSEVGLYFPIQHRQQMGQTRLMMVMGVESGGQIEVLGVQLVGQESADTRQALLWTA